MDFINKNLRGILFCFALALPATYLGKLFPVVGAPVFAILFGLTAAFWKRPAFFQPGIQFTAKKILQYSIILLGFGMNLCNACRRWFFHLRRQRHCGGSACY